MSDKSSESSCEWVVLNENELDLETDGQSLNLELNYDAVCNAASDSIRSSLSGEELEWQYEQFEDYISPYTASYIEDLDVKELNLENIEDPDVNQQEDMSTFTFTDGFENEISDITSAPRVRCYKHARNDRLNFILNLTLALVVSSAVGLGIGHFVGWSHKCYMRMTELNKASTPDEILDVVIIRQNTEASLNEFEKEMINVPLLSKNLSDTVSCNLEDGRISTQQENSFIEQNDSTTDLILHGTSAFLGSNVLELQNKDINHFDLHNSNFGLSDIVTQFNWDEISNNKVLGKRDLSGDHEKSSVKIDNLIDKYGAENVEFKLPDEFYFKDKEMNKIFKPEEIPSINKNDPPHKDKVNIPEFEFLKQFYINKDTDFSKETNLTNQLRTDLNQVIESLITLALTRLTDSSERYIRSAEESNIIIQLYDDFQKLVNARISDVDNFVHSVEYKTQQKVCLKYLQKMVYSLVDSVDHLVKVSFKTLIKENKKINVYKFSNNISKVIFNFNKKWENSRSWFESIENMKFRDFKERSFKKDSKQWKKKSQYEKDNFRNKKFRTYSVK